MPHTSKSKLSRTALPFRNRVRRLSAAFLLSVLSAGCATTDDRHAQLSDRDRALQGPVAIVAAERPPRFEFADPTACSSASSTAGPGPGPGASILAGCFRAFGSGNCKGAICAGGMIIVLGICGAIATTVGLVGIVTDLVTTPDPDSRLGPLAAPALQEIVRKAVEDGAVTAGVPVVSLPPATVRQAIKSGDYRQVGSAANVGRVVETKLTGASVLPSGRMQLEASARVIDPTNNDEVYTRTYTYLGKVQTCRDWQFKREETLLREAQAGLTTIGPMIYEDLFERFPLPGSPLADATGHSGVGLAATYPPVQPPTGYQSAADLNNAVSANDARRFQWESFPRAEDLKANPQLEKVRKVRYELLIAADDGSGNAPGETIYSRQELSESNHTVEVPLANDAVYYWTVRAGFELDGRHRVTDWGAQQDRDDYLSQPNSFSYRFKTRP